MLYCNKYLNNNQMNLIFKKLHYLFKVHSNCERPNPANFQSFTGTIIIVNTLKIKLHILQSMLKNINRNFLNSDSHPPTFKQEIITSLSRRNVRTILATRHNSLATATVIIKEDIW